jgi:AcrR family transcriptional regulator
MVLTAAATLFAERGFVGTTIQLVADEASVSPKTIEAVFGTKAALLGASAEYAIRGDADPTPMPEREPVRRMEKASNARQMLDLHAAHVRTVNGRSAGIAAAVQQAAATEPAVAIVLEKMNANRSFAARWAAATLLSKPGRRAGLQRSDVEASFWVALDWSTYRSLTLTFGLSAAQFEAWLRRYYATSFLSQPPASAPSRVDRPKQRGRQ